MIEYASLNENYILQWFPELEKQVTEETEWLGEFLPHAVFGAVLNPLAVKLLLQDDYKTNTVLKRIFEMYEEMSSNGDLETQNLVQVTLLEPLWDDRTTFLRAAELIGEQTRAAWKDIASYIAAP